MKEFALIFRLDNMDNTIPTADEIKERMNWLGSISAQNKLADKGMGFSSENAKVVRMDDIVTDGPFKEVKEFIGGLMLVKTETIEEAVELAKLNPIFKTGGSIEVREVMKPNS
mgnify:CR=1 FL=1